ncbi:MAG TPA: nodulation protein NfeD [Spirochaetota bacterium]|nr:nodulation protein NfeD [Spirochaetota bacterium]HOD16184.1 nodulation protein NfeD [Spirochaetota bacterium]HPG51855.1 nodulation protein NfeD [Spirochaetota bacterium]HPN14158.1 nodulation protein NfeD [Spirochaetota bacterium]HQL81685.1 nodulation protein NfeD [Spirochaetota bacterium]
MKKFIYAIVALALLSAPLAAKEKYALLKLDGSVNPIMAQFLSDSIRQAGKDGAGFIVLQVDTPGGMVDSMREIIKAILSSEVPVVAFTSPRGAQAGSAGGYIMLAAHVAAMAPGTEIGAMHPVGPSLDFMPRDEKGDPAGVMEKKVLNDMVAYAKSLAHKRGRSEAWAERAVREAVSSTYMEALRANVIDLVAEDMPDLMKKLDGRRVAMNGKDVVLRTGGAVAVAYVMDWKQKLFNFFADPQMILLLLVLSVIGIGIEIKSPGLIAPGVIGVAALFFFLLAVRILPVNVAGIALIALAVVLFILELKITSYGLLTVGGIASFVFGSMILFDSPLPGGSIPLTTIITAVVFLMAFMFIVVRSVMKAHRAQVTTGREGIIGETGTAMEDFAGGKGVVRVHGEIWKAVSDQEVRNGEGITVLEIDGFTLKVAKK